eukprot:scaffold6818_cov95-Cylindrotheca_fusiformis.AAC.2
MDVRAIVSTICRILIAAKYNLGSTCLDMLCILSLCQQRARTTAKPLITSIIYFFNCARVDLFQTQSKSPHGCVLGTSPAGLWGRLIYIVRQWRKGDVCRAKDTYHRARAFGRARALNPNFGKGVGLSLKSMTMVVRATNWEAKRPPPLETHTSFIAIKQSRTRNESKKFKI